MAGLVRGYRRINRTPGLAAWAEAALGPAQEALAASDQPLRCGGTWAVGLNLLPNAPGGSVGGVALPWADLGLAPEPLHRAQLSTVFPGYPQPSPEESGSAFAFRLNRDAAHLDGLLPVGPSRHRMVKEPHGWILGLPLNETEAEASPLVVWEGSHEILRAALKAALAPHPPPLWAEVDLTAAYAAARRTIFDTCRRITLPALPGEATLLHRLTLHGVAPWEPEAKAPPEGRIIAYFRPLMADVAEWLLRP
ncbi:MAG: hypothetical protein B7Y02_14875 [Rhodobacterales bacterium 17-64-5]|nr:MAG: hypothetical protein B7Y02_14875 [Rhodobacterales bacterium 17-64-5]